jgi:cell division inhibitor SulA/protein ImuA
MTLEELLRRAKLWRAGEVASGEGQSTGFEQLDALLPGGGWPSPGLVEILTAYPGIGALRLVLPALAKLSLLKHWLIWVAPPHLPYAPALQAAGVEISRLLVIDLEQAAAGTSSGLPARRAPRRGKRAASSVNDSELWAFEQALRFVDCGAALYWPGQLEALALRRLQLACEAGGSLGILFRDQGCAAQSSPASLRLALNPLAGTQEVAIEVLKCRGTPRERECRLVL